jgi:hypothetical protein
MESTRVVSSSSESFELYHRAAGKRLWMDVSSQRALLVGVGKAALGIGT